MASSTAEVARVCMRSLGRSLKQARPFSSTTRYRRNGPMHVFPPTSNPELDAVLASLQETVFIPAHLKAAPRRLIYQKKGQPFLTREEPVRIDVPAIDPTRADVAADKLTETVTLRPLDRMKDEPRHAETFNKVLDLAQTVPDAWAYTIPAFLRELHVSGRRLRPHMVEKLVRRAQQAGRLGVLVQCLCNVDQLGVKVSMPSVARAVVLAAHRRAAAVGFGLGDGDSAAAEGKALNELHAELERATKNSITTMLLIQDRRHVPIGQKNDPKECPELFGAAMALVAVRRLLYVRENSPERVAARQAATTKNTAESEEATDNTEAATAEEGAETAAATEAEGSVGREVLPSGKTDLARLEGYATQMLALSAKVNLELDAEARYGVREFLNRWLPVWFGIQVALKALPASSSLAPRLKSAFDADIEPQVLAALKAHETRDPEYQRLPLYLAYQRFLASV